MLKRYLAVVCAAACAVVFPPSRPAAAEGPASVTRPEWTGYYRFARDADLKGLTPENGDDKALDALITAHLQPWARLKMKQTNGAAEDTGAICQIDGIFRIPIRGGGFMWLPAGKDRVLLVSSQIYAAGVRKIYFNREHSAYPPLTWFGESIGRWEGDVLVIDTIGFNSKSWLTSSMHPHSEELHVVERMRMVAKGLLELRTTVDDRLALSSPYSYSRFYKLVGQEVPENICNPEEGDQRMWAEFRAKAIKDGMRPVTPE